MTAPMTATIETLLLLLAMLVVVAIIARRLNTAPSILLVIAGVLIALERFPIDVNRNVTGDSLGLANQIRCVLRQDAGAWDGEGILQGSQSACG
jgi:hypothetical protein